MKHQGSGHLKLLFAESGRLVVLQHKGHLQGSACLSTAVRPPGAAWQRALCTQWEALWPRQAAP